MARVNREKQTETLRQAQQQRKEQKRQQVFEAVRTLQQQGKTITFTAVARVAQVSISYLYKWPEVKDFIQSLREEQSHQLAPLPQEAEPGPYSLKTLHEVARKRIKELEAELQELKRQNELYRGHVAEIFELRDEVERLRELLRQFTEPRPTSKVVALQAVAPSTASDIDPDIVQKLETLGVKLGVRLQREIKQHNPEKVMLAIAAFEQYRSQHVVENPAGCLLQMIRDGAEPNVPLEAPVPEMDEFDRWYAEAIAQGFCLDIPRRYLSTMGTEPLVKVVDKSRSEGYQVMPWREAREYQKGLRRGR
jgi:hypothetical protein